MNIGENIRKYRLEKDKKQQEIYEAIGVNQSSYSKIENNKHKMYVETLKKIANALQVDIAKLIGEDKIEINHTNNDNSQSGSGIVVNNNHSEELIVSLKEQIDLLKEHNQINKEIINNLKEEIINNLKEEIISLKVQLKK
ncbi:helix-turn-helix domain-containing protein [Flavobacterium xanthum]|uniref:Helix-turn-helix domain-containing protein n=1 Tax=Flavobacterium xanthum TaxID=69322 RepID=A0A1M7BUT0_9FLAO|nr:helix-turn-helix transcriptional regulator [Flavobacterium xanthum]SHL58762.1 Helix-turn-helix domain-containing protein [Flavobacterium xanthum]